jgi:hypothetical protein
MREEVISTAPRSNKEEMVREQFAGPEKIGRLLLFINLADR